MPHNNNIGANLLKYAISTKLFELGYIPYIIGYKNRPNDDISFIIKNSNLRIVNNFTEIKKNDYDILMVNSDQTWRKWPKFFYDIAFLCFAKNWKINKFIYGASLPYSKWKFNKTDENMAKNCLKNFKGISVREKGSIDQIQKHLEIKASFVLDPTFLIDKKYYLNIINNFTFKNLTNKNYIFIYLIFNDKKIKKFINTSSKKLNYTIFRVSKRHKDSVKKFIYGIYNSKAVITDSYHGTVFSIIFRKPFITFFTKQDLNLRFISLRETFNIEERFIENNRIADLNLLTTPLNIDENLMNSLKLKSIDYIKTTLNLF